MTTGIETAGNGPGVAVLRRSSLLALGSLILNPLNALPGEVFEHGLVLSRIFGRQRVYISDPALVHEALVRNAASLEKGEELRRILGPALGDGLLTSDGATWRWQRQSMAPAFQHEKLLGLLPAMIAAAEETRDRWQAAGPATPIDIGHDLMGTTFKIILETMLSGPGKIDAARVEESVTDYLKPTNWMLALGILKAPDWMPYPGRKRAMAAAAYMRSAVRTMVADRRHSKAQRDDLVALLLTAADPESGRSMTDEEITDNLLTFVTAGHETTALGLEWTLLLLTANPAVEARMATEIEAVTGGGAVKPEHIEQLVYTRQVFSEAMRLYPPAPLIVRTVLADIQLAGQTIAAGTMIVVPIYAIHRHKAIWDRPEAFDPDRFAPGQAKARHRYAFMPFGAGNRVCIGSAFATMEAVAILAVLLKSLRMARTGDAMPRSALRVTLRPRTRPKMRAIPRRL